MENTFGPSREKFYHKKAMEHLEKEHVPSIKTGVGQNGILKLGCKKVVSTMHFAYFVSRIENLSKEP